MSRNKIDWPSRRHQIVGLGGCYFPRSLQKHRIFSEGVSTRNGKRQLSAIGATSWASVVVHVLSSTASFVRYPWCAVALRLTRDNVQLLQPGPEGVGWVFGPEVATAWSLPRDGLPPQANPAGPGPPGGRNS